MRYPGKIAPGTKVGAIVNNVDFAPAFLELARLQDKEGDKPFVPKV